MYVIATPIGNLADLSARAKDVLGAVDLVAAEDTRRCGKLLQHLGLAKRMVSLHEHNEDARSGRLLSALGKGTRVALVTDAGTPLISDPGFGLVAGARAAGFDVVSVPGPSAVTAALSVSGLAADRFIFEGFLPRRPKARRQRLESLALERRTIVVFESVHRIEQTLTDMASVFGQQRRATLARELTKIHEQVVTASLGELVSALHDRVPLLGEFVIVVAGADAPAGAADDEVRRVYGLLAEELPPSRAAALCAKISGRSRKEVYALTRE